MNSIRNKFLDFKELVLSDTDICLISETKLDDSFPDQQFHVNGYKMFRKDWNKFEGSLILFVKENIPCKVLNTFPFSEECEVIPIDLSISNKNHFFWADGTFTRLFNHHKMKLYLLNRLNLLLTLIVQHTKIFSLIWLLKIQSCKIPWMLSAQTALLRNKLVSNPQSQPQWT